MKTISEMKEFIEKNGYTQYIDINKYDELLRIIENVIEKDEDINFLYATHTIKTSSSADPCRAGIIAISNKKIYCAIEIFAFILKRKTLTTIKPGEFNDMTKILGFFPSIKIDFLTEKVEFTPKIEDIDEVYSIILQLLTDLKNTANKKNTSNISTTDEIKKYKELLDVGAITQEEFDMKKKELLGL